MSDQSNFAPYAPAKAVLGVIDRYRDVGLPDPLTTVGLERVGVPASMAPRTLQALRFLGLIDEGGNRLESFEQLKRAKTDEYAPLLAEIVRAAYLPVFTVVDPATDTDTAVADAFRGYEPGAQREKMLALFRGLCAAAGITEKGQRPKGGAPKKPTGGALGQRPRPAKKAVVPPTDQAHQDRPSEDEGVVDIRLITAIIQQLPRERRWTTKRRGKWLGAIESAVDLLIEVDEGGVWDTPKEKKGD